MAMTCGFKDQLIRPTHNCFDWKNEGNGSQYQVVTTRFISQSSHKSRWLLCPDLISHNFTAEIDGRQQSIG